VAFLDGDDEFAPVSEAGGRVRGRKLAWLCGDLR